MLGIQDKIGLHIDHVFLGREYACVPDDSSIITDCYKTHEIIFLFPNPKINKKEIKTKKYATTSQLLLRVWQVLQLLTNTDLQQGRGGITLLRDNSYFYGALQHCTDTLTLSTCKQLHAQVHYYQLVY